MSRRRSSLSSSARLVLVLTSFALALGVAAACTATRPPSRAPYEVPRARVVGQTTDGLTLYQRDCTWCHGAEGRGTRLGPDLDGALDGGAYTDFMLSTGRMPLAAPGQRAVRSEPRYDREQIDAIVAVVESFGGSGPAVPSPDPAAGDFGDGQTLYQANCAACHSTTGIGGAMASGQVAPSLADATPVQVAEATLVGPGCGNEQPACGPGSGAMPRFRLTAQQLDDLTRYVQYLQRPRDAGGWALGAIGPVAEGAAGLLVGLGVLLLVIRWTGTTAEEDAER